MCWFRSNFRNWKFFTKKYYEEQNDKIKHIEYINEKQKFELDINSLKLNSLDKAGILRVFKSRKEDDDNIRLAIEDAAMDTQIDIFLMGVAFPSLFDINQYKTSSLRNKLEDPFTLIRILLLDFNSDAAKKRGEIEEGNQTKADIKNTLENRMPVWARIRFNKIDDVEIREIKEKMTIDKVKYKELADDERKKLREMINFEVKIFSHDPIIFIMGFANSLFAEQYHFGRPKYVPAGSCIGKFVPVIQYKKHSKAYDFYKCHFEYVWEEYSDWYTDELLNQAFLNVREL